MTNKSLFDIPALLHDLKHYLPTQTPLKDFIHHNSLHAFQNEKFFDALFSASAVFGFQATLQLSEFRTLYDIGRIRRDILEKIATQKMGVAGKDAWMKKLLHNPYDEHNPYRIGQLRNYWKANYRIDLDNMVQPLLFRILCSYLDQGIAISDFPISTHGFLDSLRMLEKHSFTSFFKTKRAAALLMDPSTDMRSLLERLVGDETLYHRYIFDQQFSHKGWSGMVATVEDKPDTLLSPKKISLEEFIIAELLFEIDAIEDELGSDWAPLAKTIEEAPPALFQNFHTAELHEVLRTWQEAFEWSYYDEVLAGIQQLSVNRKNNVEEHELKPGSFQALFCIDERECSLRRHIESRDPGCETFGTPGFFSVEFYFQAQGAQFYDKLCPAPVTPAYLIKEYDVSETRKHDLLYTNKSHPFLTGYFSTLTLGFWAGIRLIQNLFKPGMSPAISNAFAHMNKKGKLTVENKDPRDRENGLQVGFTVDEMANRVASLLNGIGLTKHFSPIIYAIAHGSSSANNPHHGAHDCGACSGRPGSVNARVFAHMANHKEVRIVLRSRGIEIPPTTQFVGALHDTAADEIEYYDTDLLDDENRKRHEMNVINFEHALDLNAKERSRRFASINTRNEIRNIRNAIKARSVSLFEPRPELGHGTNTLCIVGRRSLTRGLFLDRRAFLNSYDYRHDPEGVFLTGIMKPLGPVCGGINLEYYFSRVDNQKMGAGTKLPHNVMGLIGVANSSDGDLRPGLPWQMIEVHDPLRLMIIVEHFPNIVLKVIQSVPDMYEWFINEWVHLTVVHPETGELHYFKEGHFEPYNVLAHEIHFFKDIHTLLENAKEMETNHIVHATQENLPVYLHN